MDALSDVLRIVGLSGGVFLEAQFTAPWCLRGQVGPEQCAPYMAPPTFVMGFHFIIDGSCVIQVEGEEPCVAHGGEAVLLPRNQVHRMGSDLKTAPLEPASVIRQPDGSGLPRIDHGGGGAPCKMICGFLGGDAQLEPLVETLPALMTLTVRDTPSGPWIEHSFRFAAQHLAQGDPGAATVMSKMSELLFIEAVRRHLTSMPEDRTGFLAGLRDPAIGKALSLLHSHVARDWTAEDLASAVNMSRSVFAERFAALVGQPPIKYLTTWRMQLAAHKLREGKLTIAQIAFDIGYDSEATFTRAFKREFGMPPAAWRRRAAQGVAV